MPAPSRKARDEAAATKPPSLVACEFGRGGPLFGRGCVSSIQGQIDLYQAVIDFSHRSEEFRHATESKQRKNVPRGTKLISYLLLKTGIVEGASDEDESALGIRYAFCRLPRPICSARDPRRIFGTNPKQEVSSADEGICGPSKELFELTNCSTSNELRKNRLWPNFLKSLRADFHVGEPEGPD
jgi:hypothetical protein